MNLSERLLTPDQVIEGQLPAPGSHVRDVSLMSV